MTRSDENAEDGRFRLRDLNLTAAERATVRDFIDSWSEHGRPVLFVGAGMSRFNAVRRASAPPGSKIQDWAGLVASLKGTLSGGDESISRRLPSDYLRIAQLHETQFQRARLLDAVEQALASRHFDPGPAHERLKRFPWEAIVTTNYDSLIERTFENRSDRQILKIVWDQDLTCRRPADALLLIKMHGDLALRDSIVLTEEDYRCYEQGRPGIALKVKQLLLEHPSMFVGFSLSDPNVAAIEGWIRDTTGRLKLPSIVLVHTEPLIAERDMWARRGIQLIHIGPEESLERFFDAVHGERSPHRRRREVAKPESADGLALEELLKSKPNGWEAASAKLLAHLAECADDSTFSDAAHRTFLGGFHSLELESIKAVLGPLDAPARRNVFLRTHRSGIAAIIGSDGARLDLEQELLGDASLSKEEKAGVLLRRATRLERLGDLRSAHESLVEARKLATIETTHEQIQRRLREVLLRMGDDAAIAAELLDAPLLEDAFAYARRGSVALMTRGREAALRWYTEALTAARTGDEKTAALFGLQASRDPKDWSRLAELDEERMTILPSERPRVENVGELESKAAELLLRAYKKGSKSSGGEITQAIAELREALVEVDDMGWPKSPGPNHTTAADGIGYAIVGLSLDKNGTVEQLKEGMTIIAERGLMSLERHVTPA
ncbi:MAG TPA: SIR2 family protein, partial [Polyangiaceae bacterium]|nr:SIR2 family protein [Polyangiaceae bacterium]